MNTYKPLLKVGQIPRLAGPKQQQKFKKKQIEPRLKEAKNGTRIVFFVDAAHFVMGGFLGFVWCRSRKFIQTPSGRKRFNVLGALNALTKKVTDYKKELKTLLILKFQRIKQTQILHLLSSLFLLR